MKSFSEMFSFKKAMEEKGFVVKFRPNGGVICKRMSAEKVKFGKFDLVKRALKRV